MIRSRRLMCVALFVCLPLGCGDLGPGGILPDGGMQSDGGNSDCPQAKNFLDVTRGSPGGAYPAPTLNVSCNGAQVVVAGNGIPNFRYVQTTPNPLQAQNIPYRFPRTPTMAQTQADVPLGGPTAVAVNGLPIFGPTEAPQMGYHDPNYDKLLDYCGGHTAPGGMYHFHVRPDCLFTDAMGKTSLVMGYAFDGYPILMPYLCEDGACTRTRAAKSSWQKIPEQFDVQGKPLYKNTTKGSWDIHRFVEGSGDLDRCNGKTLPDGSYAYYATDNFPYFMGCYRGTPTQQAMGMR